MHNQKISIAVGLAGIGVSLGLLSFPVSVFAAGLAALAVYIAVVDLDRFIIPDMANAAVFALGLGLVLMEAWPGERLQALADALLRTVTIGGLFMLLRFVHLRAMGDVGLGLGDVKLAAAGAPFLAWPTLPVSVALAAAAAGLAIVTRSWLRRERLHRQLELPFGAFLAPTIWVCFLFERIGFFIN